MKREILSYDAGRARPAEHIEDNSGRAGAFHDDVRLYAELTQWLGVVDGAQISHELRLGSFLRPVEDMNLQTPLHRKQRCQEADRLVAFSGEAGGVVCAACERGGFELSREAHEFMVEALGRPLAVAPSASGRALRQVERAVSETLEHHAHVRLRAAA